MKLSKDIEKSLIGIVSEKFERCWIPTDEVTFEQLKEWEEAAKDDLVHLVGHPLYHIGKDANGRPISITPQKVGIVRDPNTGKHYEYRYWPGKESEVEICVRCKRSLKDGTIIYDDKI